MQHKLRTIALMLITASAILLSSCEKWGNDPITPRPEPKQELITQGFSMTIKGDINPMDIATTKNWIAGTDLGGLLVYSSVPETLTLTGTGTSTGTNYTQSCTVAQLKAGTVTMSILPGTYTATFETPHIRTLDVFSNSPYGGTIRVGSANVGDVLDIKVNNPGLALTGSPINLTATLEDALIIVDIPSVNYVYANKNAAGTPAPNPFLLKNVAGSFHWGYLNETPLFLSIPGSPDRIVDASGYLKGNYYHLISAFNATNVITIPGMIPHEVVVP